MSGVAGMVKRSPLSADQSRQRMWSCMQQLRRFSVSDIEATAEASGTHARKYLRKLLVAGYLRVVVARASGVTGGHAVYQLIRDTGPHAPRMGKNGVLDPNLQPKHLAPQALPVKVPRAEYERALRCVRACAGMQDPEAEVAELRRLAGAAQ
jgi:hypothetical protein